MPAGLHFGLVTQAVADDQIHVGRSIGNKSAVNTSVFNIAMLLLLVFEPASGLPHSTEPYEHGDGQGV